LGGIRLRFVALVASACVVAALFCFVAGAQVDGTLSGDEAGVVKARVQKIRGLKFTADVPVTYLGVEATKARFSAQFAHEVSEEELEVGVEENKMIGLLPPDLEFDRKDLADMTLEIAGFYDDHHRDIVIIDRSPDRLDHISHSSVCGDVTDDETLRRAGIDRATTLVAALDSDADNLYVTVASKSMRPDLQIIARARSESSEPKLERAGADRVVNPQQLGGYRMASFVTQPHVVDFVDVVMHDGTLKFRLGELTVSADSNLADNTLRSAHLRDRTGALVLAIRRPDGSFLTNPSPEDAITAGDVLISVGTDEQLDALAEFALQRHTSPQ